MPHDGKTAASDARAKSGVDIVVLDVIKDYDLTEAQTNALLCILRENPTMSVSKMLEITDQISNNEKIILDAGTFSVDRILNESDSPISLFEIAMPYSTIICSLQFSFARTGLMHHVAF